MTKKATVTKLKKTESTEDPKFCPILASGSDDYSMNCMKSNCEWWERWYVDYPEGEWVEGCTVKAIFEMLRKGRQ